MKIGLPKEIKEGEFRVALTPAQVKELHQQGHRVFVQTGAGGGSGFLDTEYKTNGAKCLPHIKDIYQNADLIVKVKEPLPAEYKLFRKNQILFAFLHLAAEPGLTRALIKNKITALAYETIELSDGRLPLLEPMSEVAGKLASQIGVAFLQKNFGGPGILPSGVSLAVPPAQALVLGAGTVGFNAAKIAKGLGFKVSVVDKNKKKLNYLRKKGFEVLVSDVRKISKALVQTDLLIGAVLLTGQKSPKIVTKKMVGLMKKGSVIVDVSVDQGGCVESTRVTSHREPVFTYKGVLHYGVPNIPSVVSRSSSRALTLASFPYLQYVARLGLEKALEKHNALRKGLNVYKGKITNLQVSKALGLPYHPYKK